MPTPPCTWPRNRGRSTLRFFSAELRAQMTERLEAEQRLREAIKNDHLLLHFQPRVDITSGRITGAEALVRWQAPGEPLVHPGSFIAIAEETGLIVDIGRFVMRAACAQARAWLDAGYKSLVVSINASPRELQQERYADNVLEALRMFNLPPECLEIEITESMVVQDAPRLIRMLVRLRQMGVNIAIDDFGTGYSNLRYLQRFPRAAAQDRPLLHHRRADQQRRCSHREGHHHAGPQPRHAGRGRGRGNPAAVRPAA